LLEPVGDSAREYLERAAQLAPDDREVAGLRAELASALLVSAREALANGATEVATNAIDAARELGAEPGRLASLEAELATLRDSQIAQRHADWLTNAERRIRRGMLLSPDGGSAFDFLSKLQAEAPAFPGLDAAWDAWRAAIAAEVRSRLAARDWDGAAARLAALERAPRADAVAGPLRADLAAGVQQEQYLATPAPASELELLARATSIYPAEAERRGIEGWVDLEFVVDRTGRPKDLRVTAAEPPGHFEDAALAAVAQYRYAPFARDGRVFERRAALKIRFALQ
jgi:TonB family protein